VSSDGTAREVCAKSPGSTMVDLYAERCHFRAEKHLGEAFRQPTSPPNKAPTVPEAILPPTVKLNETCLLSFRRKYLGVPCHNNRSKDVRSNLCPGIPIELSFHGRKIAESRIVNDHNP